MKTTPFRAPFALLARALAALACLALAPLAAPARAQTTDEMNAAHNPLTPGFTFNLHDTYSGSYYGYADSDVDANTLLLRGSFRHRFMGTPQFFRATLPAVTSPDLPPAGRTSGLGDLNLANLLLNAEDGMEFGFGPQLTLPTATDDTLGTGKWQAGLVMLIVDPEPWGTGGLLVSWQTSIGGSDNRPDTNVLTAQPFYFYNLPHGWYLRSSATANWNLEDDTWYVPLGLGFGKIIKGRHATWNAFLEPQATIGRHGRAPQFQLSFGLNLQFPAKAPAAAAR